MRLILVIQSLTGGGAERVLVLLANGLAKRGHRITVVTVLPESEDAYSLDPGIDRVVLEPTHAGPRRSPILRNMRLLSALRHAVTSCQPDVVISFVHLVNVRTIVALSGTGIPVVATEHSDPRRSRLGPGWRVLRRLFYPRSARLVSVSKGVDEGFGWLPTARREVVYNPVSLPEVTGRGRGGHAKQGPLSIIAMGRLVPEKGFDLLIDAFARVHRRHRQIRLLILGEGPERPRLESDALRYGVAESVELRSFVSDPLPFLAGSDLFVLSSRWEGFALALAEAMAVGLPVVSFDCPSGPSELILDGEDGLLVPPENSFALADAMERLILAPELRQRLGMRARENIRRFDVEPTLDRWERLLERVPHECPGERMQARTS